MAKQKKRYEYSTPSMSGVLKLGSEQAKSLVVRLPGRSTAPPFQGVSPALFAIDVVTRKMGKNNPTFDHKAVFAAVDSRLKAIEEEFSGEIERMGVFIKNEGIKARASYNSPIEFPYEVTTPQIQRAADLVAQLDLLVTLVDTLWLTGRLSLEEAENYKNGKSKALSKAFRNLISTGFAARKKAFEQSTPEAVETQQDIIKAEAASKAAQDDEDADDAEDSVVSAGAEKPKDAVVA